MRDERFTDDYETDALCKCGHTLAQHNEDYEPPTDEDEERIVPCCCTICDNCPTHTRCFELAPQ